MARFTVNGDMVAGRNIVTINGKVIVDDNVFKSGVSGIVEVRVLEGTIERLEADGSVTCNDVAGNVSAGGSIQCANIGKNASAGASIDCGDISGNASAGGSIKSSPRQMSSSPVAPKTGSIDMAELFARGMTPELMQMIQNSIGANSVNLSTRNKAILGYN